ncbi:hypothetical protein QVD17_22434 [Tagetes erecta]|uniref:Uncharacterized protein n=1 Tax=Tagetes erecta TaxID=13708 RepID=A0AAD8NU11_TARER|nr:hypothetical protein QVD17_22434 [Tagetes erecta]
MLTIILHGAFWYWVLLWQHVITSVVGYGMSITAKNSLLNDFEGPINMLADPTMAMTFVEDVAHIPACHPSWISVSMICFRHAHLDESGREEREGFFHEQRQLLLSLSFAIFVKTRWDNNIDGYASMIHLNSFPSTAP